MELKKFKKLCRLPAATVRISNVLVEMRLCDTTRQLGFEELPNANSME
jgi:hypothetical protein